VLLITHDLGVAADRADRVVVMSGGRIVEQGPVRQILEDPQADYTRRLVASAPGLRPVPPRPVHNTELCTSARGPSLSCGGGAQRPGGTTRARAPEEQLSDSKGPRAGAPQARPDKHCAPLVEVSDLVKEYRLPGRRTLRAVDGVSFTIGRGETLGLVGESGSGKSTVARLLLRLTDPTSGRIVLDGADVTTVRGRAARELRRRAQLVYQNPYASLDPRFSIEDVVTEPLRAFSVGTRAEQRARAAELLDRAALPVSTLQRRPAELSGGQRQRVAIARALALAPDLVVCDEPVSALDVSVQAQVLDLLRELQDDQGLAYLFISHDLAVVRSVAHRVGVLQHGRLVELRPTQELYAAPAHPYTVELLAAVAGQGSNRIREAAS
jgi:peptide/nickel transport system ATP-binding protein